MNTTKLTRRIVLGIGIPAALATGAIAAAASSNGSPQSDKATTTITQTAPGTTEFVSVREPGEDIRGNGDEAEHQNEAGDDNGQNDQADDNGNPGPGAGQDSNSGPGGGEDSNSGPGGGNDDGSGHDAGDDNGGSGHDG